jgi:hypothetical protein
VCLILCLVLILILYIFLRGKLLIPIQMLVLLWALFCDVISLHNTSNMLLLSLLLCLQYIQILCTRRFYLSCNNLLYFENNNTHCYSQHTNYRFADVRTNNIYLFCCTIDCNRWHSLVCWVELLARAMTMRILYTLLYDLHSSHIFHLHAYK